MQQRIQTLPVLHLSMMVGQQACNRHSNSLSLEFILACTIEAKALPRLPINGGRRCLFDCNIGSSAQLS